MQVNYLDYQEDLLKEIGEQKTPMVYVFDNMENLRQLREHYQRGFLQPESLFLSMKDFKERLFPCEKVILREEKRTVLFYELLSTEEKLKLKINDYFDAIELANEFFQLFDDLAEYQIRELTGLEKWQEEKYQLLKKIRKKYLSRLAELGYTDETLAFDFKNFNDHFLQKYQGIIFVNILRFTPKEKKLLELLEAKNHQLQLYLQLLPGDFDEKSLTLKEVSLPPEPGSEIRIYQTEEDLLQLANLLATVALDPGFTILDAAADSTYESLLTGTKINICQELKFTETMIFRYLEAMYNLLAGAISEEGDLKLELKALLDAVYLPEFRKYYQLDFELMEVLDKLAREEYIYFSLDLLKEQKRIQAQLQPLMSDLQEMNKVKKISDLCLFLEGIDLLKLNDRNLAKNTASYYDALLELRSLEEMGIVTSWDKYFQSRALGLFRLALNYLRYKKVEVIREQVKGEAWMTKLITAPQRKLDKLLILNATQGVIPSEGGNNFFLSDEQRAQLGLPSARERKLREKYLFFRHVFSSNKVFIYSLKNLEENLTSSSFVAELCLQYGLAEQEMRIKGKEISSIIAGIFQAEELSFRLKAGARQAEDPLLLEKGDFREQVFSLTYYKHKSLQECYYKFYLEKIIGLEARAKVSQEISPMLLGVMVHELFNEMLLAGGSKLDISPEFLEELLLNKLEKYKLKIAQDYLKYYQDVLLAKVKDSVCYFFQFLKRKFGTRVQNLKTEWQPDNEREIFFKLDSIAVYLNGRIDLLLELEDRKHLIDFKTGSGSPEQLDFYALLINQELDPAVRIERGIYDVLAKRYIPGSPGAEQELAPRLIKDLENFFREGEYKTIYRSSICKQCQWLDICRVVMK